jgi:uncharacterized protein
LLKKSFSFDLGKENRVIRGDIRLPKPQLPAPVLFICHGFKGFKDWGFFPVLAEKLAEAGFVTVTFNFSMNGIGEDLENFTELEKFSLNTFSREQEDLAFLIQKVREGDFPYADAIDPGRIGLFGHSRGGGNSLIHALDHPDRIKAVAVWNSIHRADFFAPEVMDDIKRKGIGYISNARTGQLLPVRREVIDDIRQNRERFDIKKRLPDLHLPLLIVQGTEDLPGFMEGAKEMADLADKATLRLIEGANHTMGAVHPFEKMTPQLEEAIQTTSSFFLKHLSPEQV